MTSTPPNQLSTDSKLPADTKSKHFYIPTLDGFRALAIFSIFLSKAGLERWIPAGFGVAVFFFLSGYLITTLLRMEYDKYGNFDLWQFHLRRVFRIFPPYYLVLTATLIFYGIGGFPGETLDPWSVVSQLFHYNNYWQVLNNGALGSLPGTEVIWALSVEAHFYLLFPFLYLGLRRLNLTGKQQALVIGGLCLGVLLWRYILIMVFQIHSLWIYSATDARFDALLAGTVLGVYFNPVLDSAVKNTTFRWRQLLLGFSIVLVGLSFVIREPVFQGTLSYTFQQIALYGIFIAGIIDAESPIFRIFNHAWVRFFGIISYPFYLMHSIVLSAVKEWVVINVIAQGCLSFIICFGLSWLMYTYVEKPFAALRKRFSRQLVKV